MRVAIVFICLLVCGGAVALTGSATPATLVGDEMLQTGELDADRIILEANVDEAGTATWTVSYRIALDDDATEEAFDDLRDEIADDEDAYLEPFVDRMQRVQDDAASQTSREMAIENPRIETDRQELPGPYGIVRYEFEWVGFAAVSDDTIVAGDALSGLFLDEENRLIIRHPEGYTVESISPSPSEQTDRSMSWNGPIDFAPNEPRVTVVPASTPLFTADRVAIGLGVVLVIVGGALWLRRDVDSKSTPTEAPEAGAQPTTPSEPQSVAEDTDTEEPNMVPEELLSNEERVLRLVEENGGRMKQQEVVQSFEWSAARTSQIVGALRDDGKIESFRIGRENVLRIPEKDEESRE
ncbi:helix-turn-helix transcriptional regulator [Natronocalculus amylovorans]|uniref:DUF4897 domain-containing protein n=1 Tax=Natronocalculus amylovorans TaxID=2917812 RepID=A0AAE3K818_9EURY|nr:hypothetical protein [Natronocalculus amylovorans]MCL9816040.1 hypothetical protein [Natronocalculus amylovorans]NUE01443.1 hypothetical protein [Halorubraceae archaeon YAN]